MGSTNNLLLREVQERSLNASPLSPPSNRARGGTIWQAVLPFP
jgi:hypothetical protein